MIDDRCSTRVHLDLRTIYIHECITLAWGSTRWKAGWSAGDLEKVVVGEEREAVDAAGALVRWCSHPSPPGREWLSPERGGWTQCPKCKGKGGRDSNDPGPPTWFVCLVCLGEGALSNECSG